MTCHVKTDAGSIMGLNSIAIEVFHYCTCERSRIYPYEEWESHGHFRLIRWTHFTLKEYIYKIVLTFKPWCLSTLSDVKEIKMPPENRGNGIRKSVFNYGRKQHYLKFSCLLPIKQKRGKITHYLHIKQLHKIGL